MFVECNYLLPKCQISEDATIVLFLHQLISCFVFWSNLECSTQGSLKLDEHLNLLSKVN
jgi:hypothetical protein